MMDTWKPIFFGSALVFGTICVLLWKRKKPSYVKVAKVKKLYYYPVKSLKGIEVSEGKCTKRGFEVNGLLDRTFMLVNGEGVLISQRISPSLVNLTPSVENGIITITSPTGKHISFPIKTEITKDDKIVSCSIFSDVIQAVDCGDEISSWFQTYLENPEVRLVQQFPNLPNRKYTKNASFFKQVNEDHPVGFQDLAALHILSQASIDNLNTRLDKDKQISLKNFRPNILVDDCAPHAEDTWKYILLNSGANFIHIMMTTRCLLTTNNPETGELSQKEPLVTLRKFRIVKDPALKAITGSVPCFGVACGVLQPGEVKLGDDILAICMKYPNMIEKHGE